MYLRCALLLLNAVASSNTAVPAAPSNAVIARQAQRVLDRLVTADGPGAVVLIARGDTVIFRAARGSAQIELAVPLAADDVFRIASVTKMFTSATVLKLAEVGKLAIDDPLVKYLPDFPLASRIKTTAVVWAATRDHKYNSVSGGTGRRSAECSSGTTRPHP